MKTQHVVIFLIVLVSAWIVFLAAESHGRILETRVGLIALIALATLCFAGAFLTRKKPDASKDKKNRHAGDDNVIDLDDEKK